MKNETGRSAQIVRQLLVIPLALALVAWWQSDDDGGDRLAFETITAPGSGLATLALSFDFYGSTPTLAWSPDGQRLAFNAAYEYYGHETELGTHRSQLGLWVYDRSSGTTQHILNEQRYHPAWSDHDTIATACSPYEDCTEGLYLTDLDGTNRHPVTSAVYHTNQGADGSVVYYEGFSGYTGWNRYDTAAGTRTPGIAAGCSWEPPAELVVDQCVQQVGDVQVAVHGASGLWLRVGESDPVQLDPTPPFQFSSSAWDCTLSHSGPVAPCLSPAASQVAYVADGRAGLALRVHDIPRMEIMGTLPSDPTAVGMFADNDMPVTITTAVEPATVVAMESRMTTATAAVSSRPFRAFDFFGDTVSLSWSPDSRHVLFNSAYAAAGSLADYDPGYQAVEGTLGVYVANATDGLVTRVSEQRYHPAWVNDETVVSACTPWDTCESGVHLTSLAGVSDALSSMAAMHTLPGSDSSHFYFFDADAYQWSRYTLDPVGIEGAVSTNGSWDPPSEAGDQCVQQVGDTRVSVQAGLGLFVQVGDGAAVRIDPSPPFIFEGPGYYVAGIDDPHSGPIEPCLSPDGRRVAYVARGATGVSLHILDL